MKRLLLLAAILSIVTAAGAQSGNTDLPEAGAMPGDLLYGLEQAQESVSLALTFNEEARAEKKLRYADERLSESVQAAQTGRNRTASKALRRYTDLLEEVNSTARDTGNEKLQDKLDQRLNQRREVLMDLEKTLPEEAQSGIENALGKRAGDVSNRSERPVQPRDPSSSGGFVVTGGAIDSARR